VVPRRRRRTQFQAGDSVLRWRIIRGDLDEGMWRRRFEEEAIEEAIAGGDSEEAIRRRRFRWTIPRRRSRRGDSDEAIRRRRFGGGGGGRIGSDSEEVCGSDFPGRRFRGGHSEEVSSEEEVIH
jgi:hypothetical protein